MTKKELRAEMRRRNGELPAEEKVRAAATIFGRVEHLPAFAAAHCVASFSSLGDEPPTGEALRRWSASKRVVVPRVEGDAMRFYDYRPEAMCTGAFGISEPSPGAAVCPPEQIDLIVVPGVAFTAAGARLGRGRGYYDKYLSQSGMRAFRVGVCFAHQIAGGLPVEPHDAAMDCVITDR